jgi:hypothetical protein
MVGELLGDERIARDERENVVHLPTRTFVIACTLSAALLVAGCGGDSDKGETAGASSGSSGELFLQPVAAQGPDPFTASTATTTSPPVTRTPQSPSTGGTSAPQGVRSLSGSTPGLYGGTRNAGSCDVEKQIGFLAADRSKERAFAQAEGISQASVPHYLRGLTSVVLRADTRVTDHGFGNGRATGFQSVLQVGTAVLVDNRGVPRVRCACGNPLNPPVALRGNAGTQGRPWSGYQPTQVVAVTPAPTVITNITIINIVDNRWIERRIGDDGDHDHVVPPPDGWTPAPRPHDSSSGASRGEESPSPDDRSSDCVTPDATVTVPPGATESAPGETTRPDTTPSDTTPSGAPTGRFPTDESSTSTDESSTPVDEFPSSPDEFPASVEEPSDCPTATVTAPPTTEPDSTRTPSDRSAAPDTDPASPDESTSEEPSSPLDPSGSASEDIGPDTVPDTPDVPDGGGLIPDEPTAPDSIFDAPTDVFDS